MSTISVVTDTTHYLPAEVIERHGIELVSLYVNWDGRTDREIDLPDYEIPGEEPQTIGGDRESSGRGLTHALRAALAGGASHAPRWVLCDLNGESYRSFEWGIARARVGASRKFWRGKAIVCTKGR